MKSDRSAYSRIDRARISMSIAGTVLCVLPLIGLISGSAAPIDRAISGAAGLCVIAIIAFTELRHGRDQIALVPVMAVLIVLAGRSMDDPLAVSGLCFGTVLAQTMQGSRRTVLLRTICLFPVFGLTTHLSALPQYSSLSVDPRLALSTVPLVPAFTGLIYLLRRTLEGQAAAIAREQFSAWLSSRLLAASTAGDVEAVMIASNHELAALSPGLITLEAARIPPGEQGAGGARMLNTHGELEGPVPELIPARALRELPPYNTQELLLPL